jgi:hypothetical protein
MRFRENFFRFGENLGPRTNCTHLDLLDNSS